MSVPLHCCALYGIGIARSFVDNAVAMPTADSAVGDADCQDMYWKVLCKAPKEQEVQKVV